MEYKKMGDAYYIRFDPGDEILSKTLEVCRAEGIASAIYSGIGGLGDAQIQTYVPETGAYETDSVQGMLELISLNGNVVTDEKDELFTHAHGIVSYKIGDEHHVLGGHIKSLMVRITGEIELRPVTGGMIRRVMNPDTGLGRWSFEA